MARQPRLVVPDVALHIVQRDVNGADCFRHDTDRLAYLALLREFLAATGCTLHTYCLMTNHVHLLVTPTDERGPSMLMYKVGQHYVPYFNRRYERTGTLWEGRFKSWLVDSSRYVLACHRYVELNPVRARMVARPGAYTWSSYDGNSGKLENPLLAPHVEFTALGLEAASRCAADVGLFETEGANDAVLFKAIREAPHGGYPLVGEGLKARLKKQARRTLEPGKPGRPPASASVVDTMNEQLDL
jgi:putative transposase